MTNDTFLSAVKTMCKNCIHAPVCAHIEDTEGYAERLDACSAVKPVPVLLNLEVKCKHFQEAHLQSGSFPLWPEGVRGCDANCISSKPDPNIRAYSKYDGAHSTPEADVTLYSHGRTLKEVHTAKPITSPKSSTV